MALSRIVVFGDGSTRQFAIPFALGYIKEEDITCRVGDEVDGTGLPVYRPLTFLSPEWVEIGGTAPGNQVRIEFTRTVDREELIVNYSDGDIINEINMDTAQRQAIMLVHEVLDGRFEQFQSNFDLGGFRILNLGNPVNAQDASTKAYVDSRISTGAASAAAAAASAAQAAGSASSASGSAGVASGAATAAIDARDVSVAAANSTAGSVTAAATSASAAAGSASDAASSASTAGGSASTAIGARDAAIAARDAAVIARTGAEGARDAAATSQTNASTSATNAANSATLAQRWATEAYNVPVVGGQYSALHYATVAQSVIEGTLQASNVVYGSTNVGAELARLDTAKLNANASNVGNAAAQAAFRAAIGAISAADVPPVDSLPASAITSGVLPLARGGTGETTETGMRGVYTGTTGPNTVYPVGTVLLAQGSLFTANTNVSVYAVPNGQVTTTASGNTLIAGTWRTRGAATGGGTLVQRVA